VSPDTETCSVDHHRDAIARLATSTGDRMGVCAHPVSLWEYQAAGVFGLVNTASGAPDLTLLAGLRTWNPRSRLGATVAGGWTYPDQPTPGAIAEWDHAVQRPMPLMVRRAYYGESEFPSASSDSQQLPDLIADGIAKICITLKPPRDATNAYSGATYTQAQASHRSSHHHRRAAAVRSAQHHRLRATQLNQARLCAIACRGYGLCTA
jgi:hypothetical protein